MSNQLLSKAGKRNTGLSERQRRIYDFLSEHHVGVLSTVTPDNDPHGVVIYYAIDQDFIIHFLTKSGTRKRDNITHNNHVALTVFDTTNQATAQIIGRAFERGGRANINRVAEKIYQETSKATEGVLLPIVKLEAGAFTTFQIKPVEIRMATYARPDPGDYDYMFESIESFELRTDG